MNSSSSSPARHAEPLWWLLFSAGGVCFAVVLPVCILSIGLLWPLGLLRPERGVLVDWLYSLPGLAFVLVTICLPLFHAAHRIRHGLYDLRCGNPRHALWLCYGSAALLSALSLGLVLCGWVRQVS